MRPQLLLIIISIWITFTLSADISIQHNEKYKRQEISLDRTYKGTIKYDFPISGRDFLDSKVKIEDRTHDWYYPIVFINGGGFSSRNSLVVYGIKIKKDKIVKLYIVEEATKKGDEENKLVYDELKLENVEFNKKVEIKNYLTSVSNINNLVITDVDVKSMSPLIKDNWRVYPTEVFFKNTKYSIFVAIVEFINPKNKKSEFDLSVNFH